MVDTMRKHTPEQEATIRTIDALLEYSGTEAALQKQLDDMLSALGIWSFHIPDSIWRWIAWKATAGVKKWWRGIFGGIPDVLPMIRVSEKYMLCAPIELKSKRGQLHGKQKQWDERGIPVQVSRSPEQSIAIIEQFRKDAETVREILSGKRCV